MGVNHDRYVSVAAPSLKLTERQDVLTLALTVSVFVLAECSLSTSWSKNQGLQHGSGVKTNPASQARYSDSLTQPFAGQT